MCIRHREELRESVARMFWMWYKGDKEPIGFTPQSEEEDQDERSEM